MAPKKIPAGDGKKQGEKGPPVAKKKQKVAAKKAPPPPKQKQKQGGGDVDPGPKPSTPPRTTFLHAGYGTFDCIVFTFDCTLNVFDYT